MKWLKRLWMLWKFDTAYCKLFSAYISQHRAGNYAAAEILIDHCIAMGEARELL